MDINKKSDVQDFWRIPYQDTDQPNFSIRAISLRVEIGVNKNQQTDDHWNKLQRDGNIINNEWMIHEEE